MTGLNADTRHLTLAPPSTEEGATAPQEDLVTTRLNAERTAGLTLALQLIVDGKPGRAAYELGRSVTRQARAAGLLGVDVAPCACLGRCRR